MQQLGKNKILALLLTVGTIVWSITMVKSGIVYPFGMGFWGPNGHDGIWHIALINHLANGSLQMPTFAGEELKNYHIGFDLLLAITHKLTQISAQALYFQIVPPILALAIGWLTYFFVLRWRESKPQALWAVFFVYFGSNFGWIVTLIRDHQIGGESMFWSQQASLTLINPPFALSLVVLLLGLLVLIKMLEKFSILRFILCVLLFGTLIQIKAYAGILALAGLGIAGAFELIRDRKVKIISVCFAAGAISLLLLYPLNRKPAGLLLIQPFWFLETMMGLQDRFYWPKFFDAMTTYRLAHIWVKAIPAYTVAFLIFVIGNIGTRFIALGNFFQKSSRKFGTIDIILLTITIVGILIPTFVLQTGTPWNTIQFIYYSLFVLSIYAGIWMGNFQESASEKKSGLYKLAPVLIILLTIPTTFSTLKHYVPSRPPAKISHEELTALKFLSDQEKGIVVAYPFNRYNAQAAINNPPRSLYVYETTAYVSAFSDKPSFIDDEVNLDITGYNWRPRRKAVEEFFDTLDVGVAKSFLYTNNIRYLYLVKSQTPIVGQRFRLGETELGLQNIFENNEVVIYRVLDTI